MQVRLNLATNALQTHRRFLAGSTLIGVIAGIVFVVLGWHVYSVRKADETLRTKSEQVRQEMATLVAQRTELERFFKRPENAKLADRAAFLNAIIDEKSLNWTRMFMDLEKVLPSGVHLISIEPQPEKGRVKIRLSVAARSDEARLKLLRALEESPAFTEVAEGAETTDEHGVVQINLIAVYLRA
jgi:type IV pilus assembly protein PilN